MPRYVVEREFPDQLLIPTNADGTELISKIVAKNAEGGVTWVHSYVSADKRTTYCIYDGPDPESIRAAAERNGIPVTSITEVTVLDPYFYNT